MRLGTVLGAVIGIFLGGAVGFLAPFGIFWTSNIGGTNPQLGLVSVFVGLPAGAIVGGIVGALIGRRIRAGGEK